MSCKVFISVIFFHFLFTLNFTSANTTDDELWVTIGSDVLSAKSKASMSDIFVHIEHSLVGEVSVAKIKADKVFKLSHIMHEDFKRCGGFVVHDSYAEAVLAGQAQASDVDQQVGLVDYTITEEETVNKFIAEVKETEITKVIKKLSSFKTRYHSSSTGMQSQQWLYDTWKKLGDGRLDVSVEKYTHTKTKQPSIILTIKGAHSPDDVVVIGGHADSIGGFWGGANATAPGADDNASGVATITEVMRVILVNGYRPNKTIKFMAYAAEEVGLIGSKDIAGKFRRNNVNVIGSMQFDMTNFNGSDKDIVFMSDYTNAAQNTYLGALIDEYVHVPWGYSKCGYACSDHASWTSNSYPASIPFESTMEGRNRKIHSSRDTIDVSGGHSHHAVKFAKLAVAFIVEMAK
ncbi:MAG: M20/M25/M40 family metallo-hydrolase [Bacteriovoracaceae bacterium]|nr:M20/M25/M40 family metallo-hydrolase [Bacteriovoracaceae bacterium]